MDSDICSLNNCVYIYIYSYIYVYTYIYIYIPPCISKEDDSYWNKSPNAAAPHGNADATPYYSPPPAPEVDDTLVDEVPPAVAPGDSGAPAEAVAPGDSEVVQVPGNEGTGLTDEDALFGAETPTPPSFLSEQAADQRLRRIMTPRSNGSLKVPAQLVEQYKKNKDDVKKMFERCGHDRDCGLNKCLFQPFSLISLSTIHDLSVKVSIEHLYCRRG